MTHDDIKTIRQPFTPLSASAMAALGLESVAYIKPVMIGNTAAYGIFAADGQRIALAANRNTAIATVRGSDLEPTSVN